jgi:putative pyruvate formate lyase activating enzyme
MEPAYLALHRSGELARRAVAAVAMMSPCRLCPRECGAARDAGELGTCGIGRRARVASAGPHFGEERPLVGSRGSGTIFFAGCNLRCTFCQNWDISHTDAGDEVEPEELAAAMLRLQAIGCHNVNLVTPTHVTGPILEALDLAVEAGLRAPLVWNCGGYESVETLQLLDGVVDVYMPDFKFWSATWADRFCAAPDYRRRAVAALREMHRQVGDLVIGGDGLARRGLLVRHLVMPNDIAGTAEVCTFLASELSPTTYLNVMDQYRPCGASGDDPAIARPITAAEYGAAIGAAHSAGLQRLDRENHG